MSTTTSAEPALTPIKFSRLTRRGVLLGLSGPQLVMASLAAGTLILGLYVGAVVMTFPIILLFVALAFVGVGGRKLIEWAPIGARWLWRSTGGQLLYRRRIVKPRPAGTLALPGDAARLRQWVDPETGAVMVHDPHAATLTAIVGVSHPAFVLLDPAEQERRVVSLGPRPRHRLPVRAHRLGPGDGADPARLRQGPRGLVGAARQPLRLLGLDDVRRTHRPRRPRRRAPRQHRLDLARHEGRRPSDPGRRRRQPRGRRRAPPGDGDHARRPPIRRPLPRRLADARRPRADPALGVRPRRRGRPRTSRRPRPRPRHRRPGRRHRDPGAALRSDSAHHCVLWISEWPRSLVFPGFLAPLLLSSGVRRTFTLLYTPMRTDRAARDIRKKKTEYISDAAQRQRIGQIEDAQQTAEYQDVLQQEADLTAGHGVLRCTGLVAVSASDPDELERAVAAIEQAAIQASCETRRLWGQQAQAFAAAALPLCRPV